MKAGSRYFRKSWSEPLADLVAPCLKPIAARHGFEGAELLLFWPDIVGERLAGRCEPLRLAWPPRGRGAATLIVRVESVMAIELQHQEAAVLERINAHVGWRCVERLALRQGPLGVRRPTRQAVPPPDPEALVRAQALTATIGDEALRDALTRLGGRVLGGSTVT